MPDINLLYTHDGSFVAITSRDEYLLNREHSTYNYSVNNVALFSAGSRLGGANGIYAIMTASALTAACWETGTMFNSPR